MGDAEEPNDRAGWVLQLLVWWGVAGAALLFVYEPAAAVMLIVFGAVALILAIAANIEGGVGALQRWRHRTPVEKPRRDERPRHP